MTSNRCPTWHDRLAAHSSNTLNRSTNENIATIAAAGGSRGARIPNWERGRISTFTAPPPISRTHGDRWVYSLTDNTPIAKSSDAKMASLYSAGTVAVGPCGGRSKSCRVRGHARIRCADALLRYRHRKRSNRRQARSDLYMVCLGRFLFRVRETTTYRLARPKFAATGLTANVSTDPNVISTSACQYDPGGHLQ